MKPTRHEQIFLEGPRSRLEELLFTFRVVAEFIRGFRKLHFAGPCVTVFGSARFGEDHHYYSLAREVGQGLARLGFTVMTGGGPGLMEAANRGAKEAGGRSVGSIIQLPREQETNKYLDIWVNFNFFFIRKVLLFKYSYAFVVLPGGIGTMDELFEALTLIQTKKIDNFPIVVMDEEYWTELQLLMNHMEREKTISQNDLKLTMMTDSVEEALQHIESNTIERFGLRPRIKPTKWFWESGW